MHRLLFVTVIPAAILALAACGSPKPVKYYSIEIPSAPRPASHTYAIDLAVGRIDGSDLLAAGPIVYKTGAHEVGTYAYHRWTDSPLDLVQEKLIHMLRNSGQYESVIPALGTKGSLAVRGKLHDFAEVDGQTISGLVTMEFELYDQKAGKVLWTHYYSQSEPVQGKTVAQVVEALNLNLDRGLKEVVAGLSQYFAANASARSTGL